MEWWAEPVAKWLPITIRDVVSRRADVANNLSITRPLLIQKQTKPSASGDRSNEHLAVIKLRHGCFACHRRFIPTEDIGRLGVGRSVISTDHVRYPVYGGRLGRATISRRWHVSAF